MITGYLDALADDQKLDPTWSAPILEMRRQAERMSTIIRDLLELSKLESGERPLDEEPVDIAGHARAAAQGDARARAAPARSAAEARQRRIGCKGVENELHSIVSNLLSNAVKYTPPQGEIELRWWTDDEGGHIAVRDTGVGIAPEHIPRLTERFYRVDSGRSRDLGGSGLGLAIVQACAAAARGHADDRQRRRARQHVHLSFPIQRVDAAAARSICRHASGQASLKPDLQLEQRHRSVTFPFAIAARAAISL